MTINVSHRVHHIYQGDWFYCWAAAIAMVRRGHSIDAAFRAADNARAAGVVVPVGERLREADIPRVVRANHLRLGTVPRPLTPQGMAGLIARGPAALFVTLSSVEAASVASSGHVYVLSAVRGDGSPTGTTIYVHDPFERAGLLNATFQVFTTETIRSIDYVAH